MTNGPLLGSTSYFLRRVAARRGALRIISRQSRLIFTSEASGELYDAHGQGRESNPPSCSHHAATNDLRVVPAEGGSATPGSHGVNRWRRLRNDGAPGRKRRGSERSPTFPSSLTLRGEVKAREPVADEGPGALALRSRKRPLVPRWSATKTLRGHGRARNRCNYLRGTTGERMQRKEPCGTAWTHSRALSTCAPSYFSSPHWPACGSSWLNTRMPIA